MSELGKELTVLLRDSEPGLGNETSHTSSAEHVNESCVHPDSSAAIINSSSGDNGEIMNALTDTSSASRSNSVTSKRRTPGSMDEVAREEQENRFNEMKRIKLQEENNNNEEVLLPTSSNQTAEADETSSSDYNADDEDVHPQNGQISAMPYIDTDESSGSSLSNDDDDPGQGPVPFAPLTEDSADVGPTIQLHNGVFTVSSIEGHSDIIHAVSNFNHKMISASRDTTVKVWDAATRQEILNLAGHTGTVKCLLTLTEDSSLTLAACLELKNVGLLILSGSEDCSVRLWSLKKGAEVKSIYVFTSVTSLGFDDMSLCCYVGTGGGKLELWNIIEGNCKDSLKISEEAISCIQVDSQHVFAGSKDQLCGYKLERGKLEPCFTFSSSEWQCMERPLCLTTCSFALHSDKIYLGHHCSILQIDWKKSPNSGRISLTNNSTQTSAVTTAVSLKGDTLIASVFEEKNSRNYINIFHLPALSYAGSLIVSNMHHILCLHLIQTEDNILYFVSGGFKLLMWSVLPERTALESNYREIVHDVTYIPELDETRHNLSSEVGSSTIPLPSSVSNNSSKWRCCIS